MKTKKPHTYAYNRRFITEHLSVRFLVKVGSRQCSVFLFLCGLLRFINKSRNDDTFANQRLTLVESREFIIFLRLCAGY